MLVYFTTSESVTKGHPDKICDQISDSILDAFLSKDPNSIVAIESCIKNNKVCIFGEVNSKYNVSFEKIVKNVILKIGYDSMEKGFDAHKCIVDVTISKQSKEISNNLYNSIEFKNEVYKDKYDFQGAGDQGVIFGYACSETKNYMPYSTWLAHALSKRIDVIRKRNILPFLYPDGKTQVTIKYENNEPKSIDSIVLSSQHKKNINNQIVKNDLYDYVVLPILKNLNLDTKNTKIYINSGGNFITGGPQSDVGLTGRKIIVDTYGSIGRHGGGAFSGKDPSKVDRSSAYALRWIAKNIVATKLAKRIELEAIYIIGKANPINISLNTFGTEFFDPQMILRAVKEIFDLRPAAIIEKLSLKRPIYEKTASYGHFGREDIDFTWENLNMVSSLKSFFNL